MLLTGYTTEYIMGDIMKYTMEYWTGYVKENIIEYIIRYVMLFFSISVIATSNYLNIKIIK